VDKIDVKLLNLPGTGLDISNGFQKTRCGISADGCDIFITRLLTL
jgi:hypothetical protein